MTTKQPNLFYRIVSPLLMLLVFMIPIEHHYDKLFRYYSFTLIPEGLVLPSFFEKKIYFYFSDIITLLFFIGLMFCARKWTLQGLKKKEIIFLGAFIGIALLSLIQSPLASYPIPYIRLWQLLTPILLFFLITQIKEPRKITRTLLLTLIIAASFQAIVAIIQYFSNSHLGLRILSEPNHFATIQLPGRTKWIFDWIFPVSSSEPFMSIRPSGTLPHANVLGGFLAVSLLGLYSFILESKKKWFFPFLFAIQFFALILTFSRSALFGFILGSAVLFFYSFRDHLKRFRPVFLSMLLSILLLLPPILARGGVLNYNEASKGSDQYRIGYQKLALKMIQDHPLLGVGFQQFSIKAIDYGVNQPSGVHNIYLYFAAEIGLIGLSFLFLFIGSLAVRFIQSPKTLLSTSFMGMFITLLFIGGCDFYPLLFQQGKLLFFLVAALLYINTPKPQIATANSKESWRMFDEIAVTYDKINRILSFGMDQSWRNKVANVMQGDTLLDIASGTGDQLIACLDHCSSIHKAVALDPSVQMLAIGKKKVEQKSYAERVSFMEGHGEKLPFPQDSFSMVSCSFGIRNMSDPIKALQEMHRVLKSDGSCYILEFSIPRQPWKPFHLLYLRHILPHLGSLFSRHQKGYRYLNQTIEHFPCGNAFCTILQQANFKEIDMVSMALGAVTLYIGKK